MKHETSNSDYNSEVQKLLLGVLVSDADLFAKCRSIIRDEYFDDEFRPLVRYILDHAEKYRNIPNGEMIRATTGIALPQFPASETEKQREWFYNDFEGFCRHRAMENVILDGVDLLRAGKAETVFERVRDALTIRLMSDLGTDYFGDPEARLKRLVESTTAISTGWLALDDKLFGGFLRGALNCFLGLPGSGKSLVLQNLALHWAEAGYNVVYFSLELAEEHTSLKMDAMLTGRGTREVIRNIADTALMVQVKGKNAGRLHVKKYPEGGTCVNDFRAYLKEYEIVYGKPPDAIIVDYLDLMHPNNRAIDVSNLFIKDKYVSEELRALMHETNAFGATASQIGRQGNEAQGEFDQSHTAGGISKVNTADTVIALYAPPSYKERGDFELLLLKTRTSSGVGMRIRLAYNPESMKISDQLINVDKPSPYSDIKKAVNQPKPTEIKSPPAKPVSQPQTNTTDFSGDRLRNLMARRQASA